MRIDFEIHCHKCGEILNMRKMTLINSRTEAVIEVDPCDTCVSEAREDDATEGEEKAKAEMSK